MPHSVAWALASVTGRAWHPTRASSHDGPTRPPHRGTMFYSDRPRRQSPYQPRRAHMLATGLFQGDGLFDAYVIALTIGGICLLVSASGWLAASLASRIGSVLLGLGLLGYAGFLAFVDEGGTYRLFWYVFILPFVVIGKM